VTASGNISAVGNVRGGNITTAGLISATGNVNSGNVNTGILSLSGNVISALNVTGNTTAGNVNINGVFIVPVSTGNPPAPNFQGQIYFNSSSATFRGYNGSAWILLG
jgi:hypothetical protein